MKKLKILNVILIVCTLVAISCKENVALEYENDPALYFVKETPGQADSVLHSFAYVPGDGPDTVWVEVQTMGYLSDVDRPMRFRQTNEYNDSTGRFVAVPGKHYVPFDDPELLKLYYVPANRARAKIPVVLLRDQTLDTMQVSLRLTIDQNEYFRPGIPVQINFKILTTAALSKPALWDTRWGPYVFGRSWGPVKMKFIVDKTGINDWDTFPLTDMGYFNYLRTLMIGELNKYNAAHPDAPLQEANGTLVSFTS